MRGNSDRSETYPFSVAPANGWGHPNPTNEYVIADCSKIGKAVKLNSDGTTERVAFGEATRFSDAADAAVASGKLAERLRTAEAAL